MKPTIAMLSPMTSLFRRTLRPSWSRSGVSARLIRAPCAAPGFAAWPCCAWFSCAKAPGSAKAAASAAAAAALRKFDLMAVVPLARSERRRSADRLQRVVTQALVAHLERRDPDVDVPRACRGKLDSR